MSPSSNTTYMQVDCWAYVLKVSNYRHNTSKSTQSTHLTLHTAASGAGILCHCSQSVSMAGASAVYILDLKGKLLIFRDYRGDVPKAAVER